IGGSKSQHRSTASARCDDLPDQLEPTGILYSPGWPATYPSHTDCYWRINTTDENHIRLSFASFDTDSDDRLEIWDGNMWFGDLLGAYSGRHRVIPDILSEGTWVSLTFFSDGIDEYDGFEIHWTS
ncbi:unnamed protein product, partial [Meganyctiphanes norvegica]